MRSATASSSVIKSLDTSRASPYDTATPHHVRIATDFLIWLSPLIPVWFFLDLGSSSGLLTLLAGQALQTSAVEQPSVVIGVDVSSGMQTVAREKASALRLVVTWLLRDVSGLRRGDEWTEKKLLLLMAASEGL